MGLYWAGYTLGLLKGRLAAMLMPKQAVPESHPWPTGKLGLKVGNGWVWGVIVESLRKVQV